MPNRYQPHIRLTIPADIPATEHAEIAAIINAANTRLRIYSCTSKSRAVNYAAIALLRSGVSACGWPDAVKGAQ